MLSQWCGTAQAQNLETNMVHPAFHVVLRSEPVILDRPGMHPGPVLFLWPWLDLLFYCHVIIPCHVIILALAHHILILSYLWWEQLRSSLLYLQSPSWVSGLRNSFLDLLQIWIITSSPVSAPPPVTNLLLIDMMFLSLFCPFISPWKWSHSHTIIQSHHSVLYPFHFYHLA